MDVQFLYLMYKYKEDERIRVSADNLVVAICEGSYRPIVLPGKKYPHIEMVIPRFFVGKGSLMQAHGDDDKFKTHKATAFGDLIDTGETFRLENDDHKELMAKPMVSLKLPFSCEGEIFEWEMQAFQNDDAEFTHNCGGLQCFFVLSVVLQSQVKRQGGFHVFASPTKDGDAA